MFYYEMLREFGLTPTEFGELDAHEKHFIEKATMEYNRRSNEAFDEHS